MNIDDAYVNFEKLFSNISTIVNSIDTEADTRFKLIDEIIVDVLGWEKTSIKTEAHIENGYIDYLIQDNCRNKLIIEAKNINNDIWDLIDKSFNVYKISGPALKKAYSGMEQARNYAINKSICISVLTNGNTWIAFLGNRTDGINWYDGKAIVFPNLQSIKDNFAKFYEFFSKQGVLNSNLIAEIGREEKGKIILTEKLKSAYSRNPIFVQKTALSRDIEKIFEAFFDKITDEENTEMLEKCFVESKESKEADDVLKNISENLISNIEEINNTSSSNQLSQEIEESIKTTKGRTVILIGNKGSGKTTFISRFFSLVLEPRLKKQCLILKLDVGISTCNIHDISNWLTYRLLEELEHELFASNGGAPTFDELKGIFASDYHKLKIGEYKYLYDKNEAEFNIKFGEIIREKKKNAFDYLIQLLKHIVNGRRLMPCIIFDNLDHHDKTLQDIVFQYSQAIRSAVLSFTICPITDQTIWLHSKTGALQSFVTTALYLPSPPTKDIIQHRINFIQDKLDYSKNTNYHDYFLKKGIRLNIKDLDTFVYCLNESFINTDFISRRIGQLSNFAVRKSLVLMKEVMTSPLISIDDLFNNYYTTNKVNIVPEKFDKAIIVGNYNFFNQEKNNYILNMFETNPEDYQSPLLRLRILTYLKGKEELLRRNNQDIYQDIFEIISFFELLNINVNLVKETLQQFINYGLIESIDSSVKDINIINSIKILPSAKAHVDLVMNSRAYLSQMAIRTPIIKGKHLTDLSYTINDKGKLTFDDWEYIIKTFINYCIEQDNKHITIPNSVEYKHQADLISRLLNRWNNSIK